MPLALVGLFLGYLLVHAAVKNEHPFAQIVTAFGGVAPPVPGRSATGLLQPGGNPAGVQGPGTGPSTGTSAGTPRVQAFREAVRAKFGDQLTSAGVCACRKIIPHNGGSSSRWSEHAWCNAEDYKGSAAAMARLMVFANLNRRRYGLVNIIPPGASVNVVHVDFAPSHTGQTPPCAAAA